MTSTLISSPEKAPTVTLRDGGGVALSQRGHLIVSDPGEIERLIAFVGARVYTTTTPAPSAYIS
jgi:hypothetical protein